MNTMEAVLLGLLGALTLAYLWLRHNYWTRRGLPQPPVVFGFGNILDAAIMKNNPGLIYSKIYRSYPEHDAVGVYGFLTPRLLIRSPELIKKVLVSDFSSFHDNEFTVTERLDPHFHEDPFVLKGEEWKRNRAKLMTTMTSTRMKEVFPLMKEVVDRLNAYLDDHLGTDLDARELATLFTMDNVSSTVFGISSNCFSDSEASFRKIGRLQMKEQLQVWWKTMILFLMPRVRDFMGLKFVPTAVNDYVENMVQEVMEYRLKHNIIRNDLFQYFMKKETGNNLKELMFYGMTFFLEGFETSAMLASTALYELAMNPDIQNTLHEEVRLALSDKECPDYDIITNLPYLEKVLQESLRKYPVMYAYIRECTKPTTLEIDGKPVDLEIGTPVIIPAYAIHQDPQHYPDPDVFDPERFSEENKAQRIPYTYLPFGEGPRICPGVRFAMTQVKLFMINIVYKYKILRSDKTPQRLTMATAPFLVIPNEQQWIRFQKRK